MRIMALRSFLFLAENGCDFRGYVVLGIPRSTLWAHISELERDLGFKLIKRKKQSSVFTDEGIAFIPYAKKIYMAYEEGLEHASDVTHKDISDEIAISTTNAISVTWLMPAVKEFHDNNPHLKIKVIANDLLTPQVERMADVFLRPLDDIDGVEKVWYYTYHHGLFASKGYLKKWGTPKAPEDLRNHTILAYGESEFSAFDEINWHLKGSKYDLPKLYPSITVNSTLSLFNAATEGIGITSSTLEAPIIYKKDIVQILPKIKGPEIHLVFGIRETVNKRHYENLLTFSQFFENYIIKQNFKVKHYKKRKEAA